jgi:hypothetical protein
VAAVPFTAAFVVALAVLEPERPRGNEAEAGVDPEAQRGGEPQPAYSEAG